MQKRSGILFVFLFAVILSMSVEAYNVTVEAQFTHPITGDAYSGNHSFTFTLYNTSNSTIYNESFWYVLDFNGKMFRTFNVNYDFRDGPPYIIWQVDADPSTNQVRAGYVPNAINSEHLGGQEPSYYLDDTWWGLNEGYIYNNSNNLDFNESLLNATIDNKVLNANISLKNYIDAQDNSMGNWTADKPNYYNSTQTNQVISSAGNWTADKPYYYNSTQVNQAIQNANTSMKDYVDTSNFTKSNVDESIVGQWTFNNDVVFNQDIFVQGNLSRLNITTLDINGSLDPAIHNQFDIGSPSNMWKDIYFSGTLYGAIPYYSILVDWANITNIPANLDLDHTNDLTTGTSFGGDVSGAYNAIVISDDSHLHDWANLTNIPLLCHDNGTGCGYVDLQIQSANTSMKNYVDATFIQNFSDAVFTNLNVTGQSNLGFVVINADEITVDTITPLDGYNVTINGALFANSFNWTEDSPYTDFDGATLSFNESHLNNTIDDISKVNAHYLNITNTTSGGTLIYTAPNSLDFMITAIRVMPATNTTTYRLSVTEYPDTSNVIDTDRAVRRGTWNVVKSYALNSQIQINITSASADENFQIRVKYIKNGVLNP